MENQSKLRELALSSHSFTLPDGGVKRNMGHVISVDNKLQDGFLRYGVFFFLFEIFIPTAPLLFGDYTSRTGTIQVVFHQHP